MTFIKVVKNLIFKKVYFPLKPTWRSCFFLFYLHKPKPKQNHQISVSRAKIRSTRSQACVKYRGFIICIKRNTDVNTGDLKILHKKMSRHGLVSVLQCNAVPCDVMQNSLQFNAVQCNAVTHIVVLFICSAVKKGCVIKLDAFKCFEV